MTFFELQDELRGWNLCYEIIEYDEIKEEYDFIIEFDFKEIIITEKDKFATFKELLKKEANFNENWFFLDKPNNYPKITMRFCNGFYFESNIPNYTPEDEEIVNLYDYCVKILELFFTKQLKKWKLWY